MSTVFGAGTGSVVAADLLVSRGGERLHRGRGAGSVGRAAELLLLEVLARREDSWRKRRERGGGRVSG
jgi:hypothetical protein